MSVEAKLAAWFGAAILVLSILAAVLGFKEVQFSSNSFEKIGTLLLTLILVALVIERAVEVYVAKRYDPEKLRRRAFDAMPSFNVAVTLKTAIHRNAHHPWTNNHIHDIHALASTLPYCDVVVTDREMAALVRRSKLDQRLGTIVLHSLQDLFWLF